MAAANNTQKNNVKSAAKEQELAKQNVKTNYKGPGTEVVDRVFDAATEYCKSDPTTAKRIGGTVLICTGVGIAVGGGLMIASSF